MLTLADTDALQRLRPMLAAAVSKATSDDEQAVSEVTPGVHQLRSFLNRKMGKPIGKWWFFMVISWDFMA